MGCNAKKRSADGKLATGCLQSGTSAASGRMRLGGSLCIAGSDTPARVSPSTSKASLPTGSLLGLPARIRTRVARCRCRHEVSSRASRCFPQSSDLTDEVGSHESLLQETLQALTAPCGPRKVRPIPGRVKFGKPRALRRSPTFTLLETQL